MSYVREYKSDVFSMLMEDKANALQVYNLLNGTDYTDPEMVELVKLEKGISLSVRNDAAYIVDYELTIAEHQSTFNPNMPLRSLIYFVAAIQDYIKGKNVYGYTMIKIPMPHFVVFYNGEENRKPVEIQKLSDSFTKTTDQPELELICTVYNINPQKNDEMLDKCCVLREYTAFVEKVREYVKITNDKSVAVERAIDYCIKNHILEDFLKERRTEVLHVMTLDYTFERREEIMQAEIDEQKKLVKEKDEEISQKDEQLNLQKGQISQQEHKLSQQEQQIQELKKQIEELKKKAE